MIRRAVLGLAGALFLVGCASDVLQDLPLADRERWERCIGSMRMVNKCDESSFDNGLGAKIIEDRCTEKKVPKSEYASIKDARRPKWLLDHGCPKEIFEENR